MCDFVCVCQVMITLVSYTLSGDLGDILAVVQKRLMGLTVRN